MSEENHPNLHAVGLMTDVIESIRKRIRGKAGEAGMKMVFPLLSDEVEKFVNNIDESLDQYFGR